jgi:hypothetical protein
MKIDLRDFNFLMGVVVGFFASSLFWLILLREAL